MSARRGGSAPAACSARAPDCDCARPTPSTQKTTTTPFDASKPTREHRADDCVGRGVGCCCCCRCRTRARWLDGASDAPQSASDASDASATAIVSEIVSRARASVSVIATSTAIGWCVDAASGRAARHSADHRHRSPRRDLGVLARKTSASRRSTRHFVKCAEGDDEADADARPHPMASNHRAKECARVSFGPMPTPMSGARRRRPLLLPAGWQVVWFSASRGRSRPSRPSPRGPSRRWPSTGAPSSRRGIRPPPGRPRAPRATSGTRRASSLERPARRGGRTDGRTWSTPSCDYGACRWHLSG